MDHDPTARETRAVGSGPHWSQKLICSGMAAKGLKETSLFLKVTSMLGVFMTINKISCS